MKVWRRATRRESLPPLYAHRGNHKKILFYHQRSRNVIENKGSQMVGSNELLKEQGLHVFVSKILITY
jgi:hypothetical protein